VKQLVADLILGIGIMAAVFGVGTSIMLYGKRPAPGFSRHPMVWIRGTYTFARWRVNEWQMLACGLIWQATIWQLTLSKADIKVLSCLGEVDLKSQIALTCANLVGSSLAFYALHLRDLEVSLWVELCGYMSLVGTLGIWILMVYIREPLPNTGFGLNLTEAFVLASAIRMFKIVQYKRALHSHNNDRASYWLRLLNA